MGLTLTRPWLGLPWRYAARLGIFAACWGLMLSSLGVGLARAVDGRDPDIVGIAGPVEKFDVTSSGLVGAQPPIIDAVAKLLARHQAALIAFPDGDSAPAIAVFDFGHRVAWLHDVRPWRAYTVRGTYSDRLWVHRHATPLLPQGYKVVGRASAPVGSNAQFVVSMSQTMPGGTYVVSGLGARDRTTLMKIILSAGYEVDAVEATSLHAEAQSSRVVMLAVALCGLGVASGAAWLAAAVSSRRRRLSIHRIFGASKPRLAWNEWWSGLRFLTVGQAVGSVVAATVVVGPGHLLDTGREVRFALIASLSGYIAVLFVFAVIVVGVGATLGKGARAHA